MTAMTTKSKKRIPAELLLMWAAEVSQAAQFEMRRAFAKEAKESGITQDEIAERLGVDKSLISRRMRGRSNPTLETLSDMARAMDCRVSLLFEHLRDLHKANYQFQYSEIRGESMTAAPTQAIAPANVSETIGSTTLRPVH